MRTVRISDEVKDIVDRLVATGVAASETDFVEEAVRRYAEDVYAEDVEDDETALIAAAEEGMAAIQRGDYVTISGPDDLAALEERVWAHAMVLAEQMRIAKLSGDDEDRTEAQTGE